MSGKVYSDASKNICSGAAAEHPAADAPHAGGGEGEELGAAAAAADQAAAADGAAAAGTASPHPQHAHTGNNRAVTTKFHEVFTLFREVNVKTFWKLH